MYPIRFKPFIGKNYGNQVFKILILGESHYLNENDKEDFLNGNSRIEGITRNVLTDYINYKTVGGFFHRWMNTFTKFGNVFSNKKLTSAEAVEFWQSCVFYNYVQAPTSGPRTPPTKEEFILSMQAFNEVISECKPNLIIFWGYRLWNNFPKEPHATINLINSQIHYLKLSVNVPFLVLQHPSTRYFNNSLSSTIEDYIKRVKEMDHTMYE